MQIQMFAVYDSCAKYYNNPFFMNSVGEAIRGFQDVAVDENTSIGRHPSDFTLFHIGYYENTTSEIVIFESKKSLGTALEHLPAMGVQK